MILSNPRFLGSGRQSCLRPRQQWMEWFRGMSMAMLKCSSHGCSHRALSMSRRPSPSTWSGAGLRFKIGFLIHVSGGQGSMLPQQWLVGISQEVDVILSLMAWWSVRSANFVHLWIWMGFQENEIPLREAWAKEQELQEKREEEKREKRVRKRVHKMKQIWVMSRISWSRFDVLKIRCWTTGRS